MSTYSVVRILVALKAAVDSNVTFHCWQDFGSSEELRCQLRSTLTGSIVSSRFLVALKATVDRNVNSHCWQDSGSSESYGFRVKKVPDPPEKEILNVADPHFSVWWTSMWGGTMWFTVRRTHKWWKCKLREALKAMIAWQLTENEF